jgi:hypothetical protein
VAKIEFSAGAITAEPGPADLFHGEIEELRASPEFQEFVRAKFGVADDAAAAALSPGSALQWKGSQTAALPVAPHIL